MKKHIMLGCNKKSGRCCILKCLLPFEQLVPNELESSDFEHDATNWCGNDDINRTLSIEHLKLTGRFIPLSNSIRFRGCDYDMGHTYPWTFDVTDIYEVES